MKEKKDKKEIDEKKKHILEKKIAKHSGKGNNLKGKTIKATPSQIKNKMKRVDVVMKKRYETKKMKKLQKLKKQQLREELGEEEVPKGTTKTVDSMREFDETYIHQEDEEVKGEEEIDEFSSYFKEGVTPKILMTTNRRPRAKLFDFLKELKTTIPNSFYYERKNFKIKEIMEFARNRDFTDVMVFVEKSGEPRYLITSHLPEGPTATFRLTSVKLNKEIWNHGNVTSHLPEVILNNFDTRLGHRIGRLLAVLFPQKPEFVGRRVVTFHNQRDFVFFRHHRYIFNEDGTKASLQEIGPRFTIKLRSLQRGLFDPEQGEIEFLWKPKMGVSRKKMFV